MSQKGVEEQNKLLLKQLKQGPQIPNTSQTKSITTEKTTNNTSSVTAPPNSWKASMKMWIKSCKVSPYTNVPTHHLSLPIAQ